MQALLALLLLFAVVSAAPQDRWVNDYDQNLHYACQNHQSISQIISYHNNKHEDRLWDFSCQNTFNNLTFCSWSGYANDFDEELNYICPFGTVLSGMNSYHDDHKEDRRWKFLCCQGETAVLSNCKWSGYINDFDSYLRWDAPPNYYLVGVQSYHDNYREDRRWNYYSCQKTEVEKDITSP